MFPRTFKYSFKLTNKEKEQFAKLAAKEMKSIMVDKLRKGDVVYRIKYDQLFVVRKSHSRMNPPYLILNFDLPTELINHVVIENKGFVKIGRL